MAVNGELEELRQQMLLIMGRMRMRIVSEGKRVQLSSDRVTKGNWLTYSDMMREVLDGKREEVYLDFMFHRSEWSPRATVR